MNDQPNENFEFTYSELSYAVELLCMAYKMIPTELEGQKIDAYALYQKFVKEAVRREKQWQDSCRGVWKPRPTDDDIRYKHYECSLCGRQIKVSHSSDVVEECPYCHCGAKMQKWGWE